MIGTSGVTNTQINLCRCREFMNDWSWTGQAVTVNCPSHGQVVIDRRHQDWRSQPITYTPIFPTNQSGQNFGKVGHIVEVDKI